MVKPQKLLSKCKQTFTLRAITNDDALKLGDFFEGLSTNTCKRYGPHPLTISYANKLCSTEFLNTDIALRLIIENNEHIVGYMILTPEKMPNEINRYKTYQIDLSANTHWIFAPVIADKFQSHGLSSQVMPHVIKMAQTSKISSIVLMGGTQKSNRQAVRFYQKNGFIELGEFQTDVANIDMYLPITA